MSVSAKKDPNGTWHIQYRYTDWTGEKKKSQKRGFKTKKEAEEWLARFKLQQAGDMNMPFKEFWEIYKEDMRSRLRDTTIKRKEYIMKEKLLPYFGDTALCDINAPMIRKWQAELLEKGYKQTYLKSINNELTALMNYAVKYYDLKNNPCHKAGSMGKSKAGKMDYWTFDEFSEFADAIIDKYALWMLFNVLFWTGMRLGEVMALTVEDVDFDKSTIRINKSYCRLDGKDIIGPPKTEASIRTISMPEGLATDLKEYINSMYHPKLKTRLFGEYSKTQIERELHRGIKLSGVKKIHIHCLRHSHASMLVKMGFNPIEIAERLGHGRVTTTIETYCHSSDDSEKNIAERLSGVQKGVVDEG
ncbi:MAG: site-specific integrase [Eubacterium sp.]|nr:site-specific integrase [Eubacterium sp.]